MVAPFIVAAAVGGGKAVAGKTVGSAATQAGAVAGATSTIMADILGILKGFEPIAKIFKVVGALLSIILLPLVPILKPVLLLLAGMAKALLPIMKTIMKSLDKVLDPTINKFIKSWSELIRINSDKIALVIESLFNILMKMPVLLLETVLDSIIVILTFFTEKGDKFFKLILDILIWAGDQLEPAFNLIKTILDEAGNLILPLITTTMIKLGDVLVSLYNSLSKAVNWIRDTLPFGLGGDERMGTLSSISEQVESSREASSDAVNGILENWGSGKSPKIPGMLEFANGGTIPHTGLHLLHKGEKVIPAGKSMGSITININSPTVRNDDDIRKLTQQISNTLQSQFRSRVNY